MADVSTTVELSGPSPSKTRTRLPQFVVAPQIETEKESFPITPADIRHGEIVAVLQNLVKALDEGYKPPAEITQSFFCRVLGEIKDPSLIPWPSSSEGTPNPNLTQIEQFKYDPEGKYHYDTFYWVLPETSATFPNGLIEFDEDDPVVPVAIKLIQQTQDSPDRAKIFETIIEMSAFHYSCSNRFWPEINKLIHKEPEQAMLAPIMFDYLSRHPDEFPPIEESFLDIPYELYNELWLGEGRDLINPAISSYLSHLPNEGILQLASLDEERIKAVLGKVLEYGNFPDILTKIFTLSGIETTPPEVKKNLVILGKRILGLPQDEAIPFHTSLQKVYGQFDIGVYEVNDKVTDSEMRMIQRILSKMPRLRGRPLQRGIFYDEACGVGRIALHLAQFGQPELNRLGITEIIGVDLLPAHIAKAEAADATKTVDFRVGSWNETGLPPESVTMVVALGRDYHHAGDEKEFIQIAQEKLRIMENGAVWLFDMANPNFGPYLENRRHLLRVLKDHGYPVEKLGSNEDQQLLQVDKIVDSPDGINFFLRWTPQPNVIRDILQKMGFEVKILTRESIPGLEGSQNVYFQIRKPR